MSVLETAACGAHSVHTWIGCFCSLFIGRKCVLNNRLKCHSQTLRMTFWRSCRVQQCSAMFSSMRKDPEVPLAPHDPKVLPLDLTVPLVTYLSLHWIQKCFSLHWIKQCLSLHASCSTGSKSASRSTGSNSASRYMHLAPLDLKVLLAPLDPTVFLVTLDLGCTGSRVYLITLDPKVPLVTLNSGGTGYRVFLVTWIQSASRYTDPECLSLHGSRVSLVHGYL